MAAKKNAVKRTVKKKKAPAKKKAAPKKKAVVKQKAKKKLAAKQTVFVQEYLIDSNATQAAIRAGYSKKTAKSSGQRLLTYVDVAEAIAKGKKARSERTEIDSDYVLRQAKLLHERCMQSSPVTDKKGFPVFIMVAAGEDEDEERKIVPAYTFDSSGAARSLEIIGKHVDVQAFNENFTHKGKKGEPVNIIYEVHSTGNRA